MLQNLCIPNNILMLSFVILFAACAVKLQQAVLGLSSIAIAAHIAFQITLVAENTLSSHLVNCEFQTLIVLAVMNQSCVTFSISF